MANPDNVLSTLLQGLFISRDGPHDEFIQFPFPYFQEAAYPTFLLSGGQYILARDWADLSNGQFHHLRITEDGKLMVDATVTAIFAPTVWTQKYYIEMTATQIDQTINFGFLADQVIISNDDTTNAVHFNYGAAAIADASHDKILAGESFVDQVASNNIHVICPAGKTALCRIWARKA